MSGWRIESRELGRLGYARAYEEQQREVERVLGARGRDEPHVGTVLLVEHDPVITVSRRPGVREHLVATPELLAQAGVEVAETDRGGDITYHGPGQIVVYPIVDLNRLRIRLHEYLRLLERSVIDTIGAHGISGRRDPDATGVWVGDGGGAKIAAIGVRVRKWVTMHGLALNVATDLEHFGLIVPCGLHGRPVTSMERELGGGRPEVFEIGREIGERLRALLLDAADGGMKAAPERRTQR